MTGSVNTADEYEFITYDEVALSPEEVAKIRDWLEPTDYLADSGEFRRHLLSQAPGTGLWICETEAYSKWHDSPDHGSLWINGVPGAGKSVTAASIIQHLRTTEDYPVLFFFFRNIVAANFSPRGLIQDWLAQLLPHSPRLQVALRARLQTNLEEISDSNLIELFTDGISCVPKLYCVVDALDEMTADNRAFLEHLNSLSTYRPRSLKLLMTSRPKQYLQSALRDSSIVHISLQKKLVDRDILSYLNHRFDAALGEQQDLERRKIIEMVATRSEGLFLYAKLAMDQVEAALTAENAISVDELEKTLPAGLEETYDKMLRKQRDEHGVSTDSQVLVLQAVIHASRPLRLNELASLIACVAPASAQPKGYKALVAKSCGPLVEILEDETLQVVHHSFTEFLRGDTRNMMTSQLPTQFPIINSETAHKRMAVNCLKYLQSGSLGQEGESDVAVTFRKPAHQIDIDEEHHRRSYLGLKPQEDPFKYQEARLLHPFLQYAVTNWHEHASSYDIYDEEFFAAILGFLNPNSVALRRWLKLQWGATSRGRESPDGLPTALHLAAYSGLTEFSTKLIQDGASVSSKDAQDRIPIHWAAANGHEKVVSLLIKNGSDPNAEDAYGLKPIHLAARKNHDSVVTILLEAGVKPDTKKTKENHSGRLAGGERITKGECAILYACRGGHVETVIAMIPFCKGKVLERLLCDACKFGLADAVLAILEKTDVSANATFEEATALYFACRSRSAKCAEALIKRGADVAKMSTYAPRRWRCGGGNEKEKEKAPLHCLVSFWDDDNDKACRAILRLLVDAGADLEQLSGGGNTPLLIAVGGSENNYRSHVRSASVRALVEAGADVSKEKDEYSTAHLILGLHRDPDLVRLLIEHGVDPNKRDKYGETLIHCCVKQTGMITGTENTMTIVKYLLDQGADPNLLDKYGSNAVCSAMSCADPEIFELLLSKCNDDLMKRKCWFQLSSTFNDRNLGKNLKLLLAAGVDIDTKSRDGRTLYLCSLRSEENLQLLREHGAKTDVVDNHGNNALHILASGHTHREKMEKRIADGVDPLSTNKNGKTLLHHAAPYYNTEKEWADYVRWLIGLGISVNAVDKSGQTILHHYLMRSDSCGTIHGRINRIHFLDAINFQNEVDFEIRDEDGFAPIHIAATKSEVELAKLVATGADPMFVTQRGQNILHLASCARQPGIVGQILDQFGTSGLEQKDDIGRTPLHYACSSGEAESVAILLQHGADVHATDLENQTPLHTSAYFKEEQALWDAGRKSHKLLKAPQKDRLRPSSSNSSYGRDPWYRPRYSDPDHGRLRKTYFPQVTNITSMLLDAGSDPSAANKQGYTAVDIALDLGCSEFLEPFWLDENLFVRATKALKDDKQYSSTVTEIRQRMKMQMALMRPRPYLTGQTSDISEVLLHPQWYLELLPCNEIVNVVNTAFSADATATTNYELLKALLDLGNLQVLEEVPNLLLHYSSHNAVKENFEALRKTKKCVYSTTEFTTLQLVCGKPKIAMQLLRHLVEKLSVDVNARYAFIDSYYDDRNKSTRPGGTVLHVLASANEWWKLEAMRYLLANGADPNAVDEHGQCAIHIAAGGSQYNDQKIEGFWKINAVRILLDHGADPNVLNKYSQSPLHKACSAPDVMAELLQRGADPTLGPRSPLFQAIFDQNLAAFETLLDHGLSVDSLDTGRHSRDIHYSLTRSRAVYALVATAYAEQLNHHVPASVPLLRTLVKRGANLYLPLNEEETLIHFLFQFPEYAVLDTLLQEPCVARIDFNHRDQNGRTVLMAACTWHEALPGYFHLHWYPKKTGPPLRILDLNADATLVDDEGKTALHHLLDNNGMPDDVIFEFIQRKEVAPTLLVKDKAGFSPFHYALRILRPEVCELLLSLGADLLEADPDGLTALHYIAMHWSLTRRQPSGPSARLSIDLPQEYFGKCLVLWQKFLAAGGSINCTDNSGNTPMHLFMLSGDRDARCFKTEEPPECCHIAVFEQLFPADSGADIFAVNNDDESMLHLVSRSTSVYDKHHDKLLFEGLVHKGLDPLREDARGRSALDVASACQKEHIVELLGRK